MDGLTALHAALLTWTSGWKLLELALALLIVVTLCVVWRPASRDAHKRGTEILQGWRARRKKWLSGPTGGELPLTLAGVRIAPLDETKHFKLIGTTGTGKSTAIRELLRCALGRGDRAVITDPDGGYMLSFYNRYRGDVILNPFEPHAVKWNPFAEIRQPYDIDQLAGGLIPTTEDRKSTRLNSSHRL